MGDTLSEMATATTLVRSLKKVLKQHAMTYAIVGKGLGLSEASIKRMFAAKHFSLKRLEQVCAMVGWELGDLFAMAAESEDTISELTQEQEEALASDSKLLLVAFLLFSHWSSEDIMKEYSISETQGIRLLARLDRLKIIDLLPGNRVKMHLARNFMWRRDGPIQRFFESHVQQRFFESSFAASGELRLVVNGMLSDGSNRVLQQRMKRLVDEFESLMEEDRKLELRLRRGTTMVLAIRPWELNVFAQFRRDAGMPDADIKTIRIG